MSALQLERPLVCFDLETTGTDPATDKIVEIAALRLDPDGTRAARTRRINPRRPIPPGATAVHGIRDEDVRDAPAFDQIARGLLEFMDGADLAGFNIMRFDVPLLERELRESGLGLDLERRKIVDVMTIFHRQHPRDLGAAVRLYLGRDHAQAHAAEADVAATLEVLEAQLSQHDDLPRDVDGLDAWIRPRPPGAVDRQGKFRWSGGEVVLGFGKHQGRPLRELAVENRGYLEWILGSNFPSDAKQLVRRALDGEFPAEPET